MKLQLMMLYIICSPFAVVLFIIKMDKWNITNDEKSMLAVAVIPVLFIVGMSLIIITNWLKKNKMKNVTLENLTLALITCFIVVVVLKIIDWIKK